MGCGNGFMVLFEDVSWDKWIGRIVFDLFGKVLKLCFVLFD